MEDNYVIKIKRGLAKGLDVYVPKDYGHNLDTDINNTCRSCEARFVWGTLAVNGKPIPLRLVDNEWITHFDDCPCITRPYYKVTKTFKTVFVYGQGKSVIRKGWIFHFYNKQISPKRALISPEGGGIYKVKISTALYNSEEIKSVLSKYYYNQLSTMDRRIKGFAAEMRKINERNDSEDKTYKWL